MCCIDGQTDSERMTTDDIRRRTTDNGRRRTVYDGRWNTTDDVGRRIYLFRRSLRCIGQSHAQSWLDDAIKRGLGPLVTFVHFQPVLGSHFARATFAMLHPLAWTREMHVEVRAVDSRARVVLDTPIDVFIILYLIH